MKLRNILVGLNLGLLTGLFLLLITGSLYSIDYEIVKSYDISEKVGMSAYILDDFNPKYGAITLTNKVLGIETDKIAEYSLVENSQYCLTNCEASGKVVLYQDSVLFDSAIFKTLSGQETSIQSYKYYIFDSFEDNLVSVPVFKQVCSISPANISNGTLETNICHDEVDSYKLENQPIKIWNEYKGEILKAGQYEWKITGVKSPNQDVDFIPVVSKVEFQEWATWESSFNTGFQLYWNLNQNTGTTATASVGTTNGAITAGRWNASNGILGGAYEWYKSTDQANTDYIQHTNSSLFLDTANSYTYSVWVYPYYATCNREGYEGIFGNDGNNAGIGLSTNANTCQMRVYNDVSGGIVTVKGLVPQKWNMVTVTNNATAFYIYTNGTLDVKATTLPSSSGSSYVRFGANPNGDFHGLLDEVMVWNRALTPTEINTLYNAGAGMNETYPPAIVPNLTAILSSPVDNFNTTDSTPTLTANFSSIDQNITSVLINVTNSSGQVYSNLTDNADALSYNTTWTTSVLADGNYNWKVIGYGSLGINATSTTRNFSIDTTAPIQTIISPVSDYRVNSFPVNVTINVSNIGALACWYRNATGLNVTYTCNNWFNYSVSIPSNHELVFYSNDSLGNLATNSISFAVGCPSDSYYQDNGICATSYGAWLGVGSLAETNSSSLNAVQNNGSGFLSQLGSLFMKYPIFFIIMIIVFLFFSEVKARRR